MSARSTMTMRATVSRNSSAGTSTDAWGSPVAPVFAEVAVVPCIAWSERREDRSDSSKSGMVERMLAMVPVAADVEEEDQLVIRDRRGVVQFGGPVAVRAKFRNQRPGSRPSHYTLDLTRHV